MSEPTKRIAVRCLPMLLIGFALLPPSIAVGQRTAVPRARDHYMGRRIAQTMHYTGAEWLTRDSREKEERASLMLEKLQIKRGMMICDMGCGNGYHTLRMAKLTGPRGRVFGVDVQPEMLVMLRGRTEQQGLENVIPVLGSMHNPRLPAGVIDLILLVDVYHEFSHPESMLTAMRESLAPAGLVALLEYRGEDPTVPIKPLHKMTKAQILKEYPANGFKLVKEYDGLPWQHMMFFGKDPAWKPAEAVDKNQPPAEKNEPPTKRTPAVERTR